MLGQLTKQLIGEQVKDAFDSLRPPDLASISESIMGPKTGAPPQEENIAAILIGQMQAMQKACKEEDELVVLCTVGLETLRVLEVFVPNWKVVVLTGIDTDKRIARIMAPADSLQLVCKQMSVAPPAKPTRIRFITPKPKGE
jgi:hypothetical protein